MLDVACLLPAAFQLWSRRVLFSPRARQMPEGIWHTGAGLVLPRDFALSILASTSRQSPEALGVGFGSTGRSRSGIFLGRREEQQTRLN